MFGEICPCGYNESAASTPFRSTYHPVPKDAITREQFGVALYDAIKLCGGILQCQYLQTRTRAIESGRDKDYRQREMALAQELADTYPKLTVFQQQALLGRYPKLFGRRKQA
jgi:hypothetical protein